MKPEFIDKAIQFTVRSSISILIDMENPMKFGVLKFQVNLNVNLFKIFLQFILKSLRLYE